MKLEVFKLNKQYNYSIALNNLSFSIESDEITGFICLRFSSFGFKHEKLESVFMNITKGIEQ